MISIVGAVRRADQDRGESDARKLGDLLYADTAKPIVSEKEWVALVGSIAAGDQLALHSLYERTHRIVFTLIVRITNNREIAEELTVDVFYDVWRRAATYGPEGGSVVGWIMNQARSRAIDRLRFEQRKKRLSNTGEMPPTTTSARRWPSTTSTSRATAASVSRSPGTRPPRRSCRTGGHGIRGHGLGARGDGDGSSIEQRCEL